MHLSLLGPVVLIAIERKEQRRRSRAIELNPPSPDRVANPNQKEKTLMRKLGIIAVLSLMALALAAVPALAATTITPSAAPTGTHLATRSPTPTCSVINGTVRCNSYTLAGVGNADATATLDARYSATVDCRNHGGKIVESHSQTTTVSSSTGELQPKNGKLIVPALTSTRPTNAQFTALATCPNPNWTAEIRQGTIALTSFTYTLKFEGFQGAYIRITG
jgi:hypothetical protein